MKEIFTNYGGCRGIHYPVKFKKVIQHSIASLLFLLMCTTAFAQGNKITGVVSDEKGLPLPGVSVLLKGTQNGTVTDVNGKFNINATATQTLVFTFLGYAPKEVLVGDQTTINISMAQASNSINEVVVVGYGTQKKVTITGSIAAVTSKDIVTTKNENVLNTLTGKVAGLRIVQNSSEPGNFDNSIDIRGFGNPLVVIDGVPRDNITRLDPNDIESVSVLKDGSAAIYGVRAANGVILVTTKRGKKGSIELNYSGTFGFEVPSGLPKPVGAVDFMTLTNENGLHKPDGAGKVVYSDDQIAAYRNGTKQSTDWYSQVIKNKVPQSQHTLNASGGNDNTNYFISFGLTDQAGFLKSDDLNYKRYNVRSNITSKITKDLTVDLNLNATMDQKNQPYQDAWWIIRSFWRAVPTQSVYANNNPAYLQNGQVDGTNPVALSDADVNGYKKLNNKWFQSSVSATYNVPAVPGLSAKGLFSYDYYMSSNKIYQKAYNLYDYDSASNIYKATANQTPAIIQRQFYEKPTTLTQLSLNYNHSFKGGHNVTALLLYEESERTGDNINAQRELSLPVDQLSAGNAFNQVGSTDNGSGVLFDRVNKSEVGRINYDFQSKYLFEFSFRRDGSSYFSPVKQYGFFPGGSIGWRVSQENFFKNSSALSFVDDLKLRLSYAQVGDDSANDYQFLSGYYYPANGNNNQLPTGSVFDGTFVNSVQSKGIPNADLTWQNAKLYNVGIDLQAWKGLLGITFDVYRRDKTGEYARRDLSLPGVVGADLPQENLNSSRVQGFDFEVNHKNKIGDVNYFVKATFAYNRFTRLHNESSPYGNAEDNYAGNQNNRYQGVQYGLGSNGQYTSYQDILNSPVFVNHGTVVGDYKYEDWNGDGVINGQDAHPIAYNGSPLVSFGLTLGASYKGFDINTLWQGAADVDVAYFEQLNTPLFGGGSALSQFLDRYHPADPKADPYDPNTIWVPGHFAYTGSVPDQNSLENVQSAAYVRLKTAEIGYSLTSAFAKKIGIKGARIFVNGYNVFTITGLKYLDPEHPSSTYGYLYPLNKIFSLGVNVKL